MVIGNFEWMACFTLILLALVFAPFYINSGVRTLPEFMEQRYCPTARTFLAFIGLIGALLIHIGISQFAAAKVFESFLGVSMMTTLFSSARAESVRRNVSWHEKPCDLGRLRAVRGILAPILNKQWDYDASSQPAQAESR